MNQTKGLYSDEHVIRLVAAQISVVTAVVLLTGWLVPALLLVADFAVRAFTYRTSPLAFVAKAVVKSAGWASKPVFAPPKRFAALLGFVFSVAITTLLLLQVYSAAYITAGVLLFCAVLESAFKICLGCYTYNWLVLPLQNAFQKNNQHP